MADREKDAFVRRLDAAAKRVGSLYALAKLAGVSDQTLYDFRRKGTDPSRGLLVRLAVAAGVSVEWLATGKEPLGWDPHRFRDVMKTIEVYLRSERRIMDPHLKADLIAAVYEEIAQQERPQAREPTEPRTARIVRLVEKRVA